MIAETPRSHLFHPLGGLPTESARSQANRDALVYVLRLFFAGALARDRINLPIRRGGSATGAELAPRFVSELELINALEELRSRRADLHALVLVCYADGKSRREIARILRLARETVGEKIELGLGMLLDTIFSDRLPRRQ